MTLIVTASRFLELEGLADQHLVVAHPVEVAGVDQRDPGVEGGVEVAIDSARSAGPSRSEYHGAEAEGGDGGAGGSELT